ncbi:TY-Chap domain-containing protein [Pseudarthrobacter sp. NPDC092439]|uniref:TY-Chap domain-containing protein n=1 Tax=unclassified Pseudarthrobacter TaxID=2647000 RepID=UPI0038294B33
MRDYDMLRLLSTRVADQSEQQRSEALRRRCSETAAVLRENSHRILQLLDAGIESSDIPKILVALGATFDVDIAVELLKSPVMLKDPGRPSPFFVTDMMWLRYVTGCHREIEADHQLALGKIPMPNIQEFRMILTEQLSRRQIAQVIAVIETIAEAISNGDDEGISYSEYEKARKAIVLEAGRERHQLLPPPAELIRDRTTGRSWHVALESVGMKFPAVRGGFSAADFADASHSYRATEGLFGSPKDVASYDSWMIAEVAMNRDRPSAVAIGRHFGAWESVIGAYVPLEEDELRGIVNHLRADAAADYAWARAAELISEVLRTMPWNSFLSIQYGDGALGGPQPYAQITPGPDGAWCEIVSEDFLAPDDWPIHPEFLLEHRWSEPDSDTPNWYREGVFLEDAGHLVLEGLRSGRSCHG